MRKEQKIWLLLICLLLFAMITVILLSESEKGQAQEADAQEAADGYNAYVVTEMDRTIPEEITASVSLAYTEADIQGEGIEFRDQILYITQPGTYYLSGILADGRIEVSIYDDEAVYILLDGVEVHSAGGPALYVPAEGKVIIASMAGSENVFEDLTINCEVPDADACIYSNGDLIFNGEGMISFYGYCEDAIAAKGLIKFISGRYAMKAVDDGIRGRDGVLVTGGTINVQAEGCGIKATMSTNERKGSVAIEGGELMLIAGENAISAVRDIAVHNSSLYCQSVLDKFVCRGTLAVDEECLNNDTNE